jgi:hypothetical protein
MGKIVYSLESGVRSLESGVSCVLSFILIDIHPQKIKLKLSQGIKALLQRDYREIIIVPLGQYRT